MQPTLLTVFDAKSYEKEHLDRHRAEAVRLQYVEARLTPHSLGLIHGPGLVSVFVNDVLDRPVLERMRTEGVELVALRCAGYNNVDIAGARELGINVTRVPDYSPYAVAEHSLALMLTLNRKTHRAYNRVREGNFALNRLVGFDMHGKQAGVIGTGKIGLCMVRILRGLGMQVVAHDRLESEQAARELDFRYVDLPELLQTSQVVTLHVPLNPATYHLINAETIAMMRPGAMLINTSRGGLVDTAALIRGLKDGRIGSAGLDVYEEEADYFFADHSGELLDDELLIRLISFPNVVITSHQAFLTEDALDNIAESVMGSVSEFLSGKRGSELSHAVLPEASGP